MKNLFGLFLISCVLLALEQSTSADQILLPNGDKISGQIIHISDGEIQLVTEYAGTISVDFAMIEDLKTDTPGRVVLKNGDRISGRIAAISGEHLVIVSESLGTFELPRTRFEGLNSSERAEEESAELQQTREALEEARTSLQEAGEKLEEKDQKIEELTSVSKLWSGSFSTGVQLQRGNTDTADVLVDLTAKRIVPREELRLRFYADYGETEGETDTNKVFGQAKLKVFQTERRYIFGLTDMEYDEIESLDLRAQVFGGLGYDFIKKERTHLLGEIGAGLTGEFYDGEEEDLSTSLYISSEWRQRIFDNAEFFQGLTVYPSLSDFGDYRLRSESTITTPLGDQWAVKLSLIDEYDSDPENEDTERNDLRLISSLEYKF